MISPETTGEANLNPPVTLSWETPDPFGQGCTGNSAYQVFLSQVSSPDYFRQTSEQSMTVSSLSDGIWYWTVRSVNHYYIKQADDVFSFTVCFCFVFLNLFFFFKIKQGVQSSSTFNSNHYLSNKWTIRSLFNFQSFFLWIWRLGNVMFSTSFFIILSGMYIYIINYFYKLFCLFVYLFIYLFCLFVYCRISIPEALYWAPSLRCCCFFILVFFGFFVFCFVFVCLFLFCVCICILFILFIGWMLLIVFLLMRLSL